MKGMIRSLIRLIVGGMTLFTSVMLFGFIHLSIISYYPLMTGWSTPPGRYFTAMSQTEGSLPLVISLILFIFGVRTLLKEYKENKK